MRPYVSTLALATFLLALPAACDGGSSEAPPAHAGSGEGTGGGGEPSAGDSGGEPTIDAGQAGGAQPDAGEADVSDTRPCVRDARVVRFDTSDGVTLEADLELHDDAGPAVVLVHMIPPGNDRSSYPPRVRDAVGATGVHVLNLDRRGAGGSGGEARDAYEGEGGRLDIEAAVRFLSALPASCGVDLSRLYLVGASNGTTSVLDYALSHDESLPDVSRMVWLSPGTYTENQHAIDDSLMELASMRLLIVRPDSEDYAERFIEQQPAGWDILTLEAGQHGTRNFDEGALEAQQLGAMTEFLAP